MSGSATQPRNKEPSLVHHAPSVLLWPTAAAARPAFQVSAAEMCRRPPPTRRESPRGASLCCQSSNYSYQYQQAVPTGSIVRHLLPAIIRLRDMTLARCNEVNIPSIKLHRCCLCTFNDGIVRDQKSFESWYMGIASTVYAVSIDDLNSWFPMFLEAV